MPATSVPAPLTIALCLAAVALSAYPASAAAAGSQDALYSAAKSGDVGAIAGALGAGAQVDGVDEDGNSALHWAAWKGNSKAAAALVEAGASVDATDGRPGNTALMKAAFNGGTVGHTKVVTVLIDAGANVDLQNGHGTTALMNAAQKGNTNIAKRLCRRGKANVHVADQGGVTALHKAAWQGSDGVIRVLMAAGANVEAKRLDGVTPIVMAQGKRATIELLLENGAKMPEMKQVPGSGVESLEPAFDPKDYDEGSGDKVEPHVEL